MNNEDDWVYLELKDLARAVAAPTAPLPPTVSLRAVRSVADLQGVAEVINAAFGSDGENAMSFEQATQLVWHPGLDVKQCYLAIDGDLPVGVGVGSLVVPAPGEPVERGHIDLLAVRPQYWHRGIGSCLLRAVLSWLAERGVSLVNTNVVDPIPLLMMERVGFFPVTPESSES